MSVIEIVGSSDRRSLIKRFERKSKHDAIRELIDWLEINWRRIEQLEGENKALAAQQAVVPDGYVLMPKALTAENGAKGLLLGEFRIEHEVNCSDCYDEADPECEVCGGEVQYTEWVYVSWDTIKAIYAKAVAGLACDGGEAA